jgi:hypothetical protein
MDASERDSTQDWLIPDQEAPPRFGELVERVDEALAVARASEAAVMTVGAAALDAAEQARRAAELAESASAALLEDRRRTAPASAGPNPPADPPVLTMRGFSERADRVAARLGAVARV